MVVEKDGRGGARNPPDTGGTGGTSPASPTPDTGGARRGRGAEREGRARGAGGGLAAIIKKEFARFFTDKRMVITTLLLPGLMIFVLYSFMGDAMGSMFSVDEDYVPQVYAVDLPASLRAPASEAGLDFEEVAPDEVIGVKERIADKEADLLAVFPADFDEAVSRGLAQGVGEGGAAIPQVELYYNSTRPESGVPYSIMATLLDAYRNTLSPVFTVNAGEDGFDLATEEDVTGSAFATMLPFLITFILISSCMGIVLESIAGEKERGTIATMLITPLARWELALGKVLSLGVISLLSGLSSFIGIILSLPRMMGGADAEETGISAAVYGMGDYAMLFAVTLSTVLLFVGLMTVLSAFARTVKEAGTFVTPLMLVVAFVGVLGMFSQQAPSELWYYLIPIYNSVQCMVGVFSFSATPLFVATAVAVNLVACGLCVLALTRMFNSERIIFAR
jgi:sodium transport system permease protein